MNNNRNNRRRGRGNRPQGGSGNQLNRIDSRARGNAPQMLDKYKKLAQDAQHNGDRVQMEYYLQFADHYFRVIADNKARQDEQRGPRRGEDRDQNEDTSDEDGDFDRNRRSERGPRQRRDDRDDDSRSNDEGEFGQEGESFIGDEDAEEPAKPEPQPRRRQPSRKPQGDGEGARTEKRAEKPTPRARKPRKSAGDGPGGLDSSILPPSIRGDDARARPGDDSGDSDGTLEAVG
ncbi:DUF4167 domain-containing protein [Erythrobacter sanguineus]|uniref:DUF4167 domain-containing protein n=1 Tax=Erythrobacter sanguineus TaxID=198312 RepID=A0A1M7SG19_9SPHN|nr:DUF4167 domain-containing protein [Erythrobacter sanguineus]MCR9180556.1 DUF4167 domain-containing protein [Erythrobacteraceae bacterium]SHN57360.1 protein of unknown function [Erythrobacter sanguineus]